MSSIADALADARRRGLDRLDAQVLLAHVLQRPRTWLLAHDEQLLSWPQIEQFVALCARRADHTPLAYLVGEREFRGLSLTVTPAVLVPRPETEHLVDWALECLAACDTPSPDVVDLGTGSGAIALAVARAWPRARVVAVDRSADALNVARGNGQRLGLAVDWQLGDWWLPLADQRFQLVVSNPPYVAAGDAHLAALRHEPPEALVGGDDGLAALQAIIGEAPQHLLPGGWLLLEHGHDQADAVRDLLRRAGLEAVQTRNDLAGLPRCSGGQARHPARN